MSSWIGSDIEVTIIVWSPDFDSIIAWELQRAGLIDEDWVKTTCSASAGVGVRFAHSVGRHGAICMLRKREAQIDQWIERWHERFDEAWTSKAKDARLTPWKALLVYGDSEVGSGSLDRHHRLSNGVEAKKFDHLPEQITRLSWCEVEAIRNA